MGRGGGKGKDASRGPVQAVHAPHNGHGKAGTTAAAEGGRGLAGVSGTQVSGAAQLANYRMSKTLGIGSFGKVKAAEHLLTGRRVAIKILNREKVRKMEMEEKVYREIKILRLFRHPHIIKLYDVIETPEDIYLVLEYLEGGELFDHIVEKGKLGEAEARKIFQQVVSGIEYCHRNMVTHRDLKPENLLLDSKFNIKVADFGLSNVMRDGHFLKTSCGSPNYAAPEVISGKLYAGPEVDIWSIGVILYALLCGSLPFDDENIPNLFKKIKNGVYHLPNYLSASAKDLISRMLIVDPLKRISMSELRQHPWLIEDMPRYLAVMRHDSVTGLRQVDEEALNQTVNLGFNRSVLRQNVTKRVVDPGTVAYYLLLDGRGQEQDGYLASPASPEEVLPSSPNMRSGGPLHTGLAGPGQVRRRSSSAAAAAVMEQRLYTEKRWALGVSAKATPKQCISELLQVLQALGIRWKKLSSPYSYKCRADHSSRPTATAIDAMQDVEMGLESIVKLEINLYKKGDGYYLIDLQLIDGELFGFLDITHQIVQKLHQSLLAHPAAA